MTLVSILQNELLTYLKDSQQQIVVAYSGGVDSHVLLHCLFTLRQQNLIENPLKAIHIHHGLSPHADAWAAHCYAVCQNLQIPIHVAKVNVPSQQRQSLEATARDARYTKLFELSSPEALVLLGQHQDDQLETFLLQLKRGAGPKGLGAMAHYYSQHSSAHSMKNVHFLRPLLGVSQENINTYANQQDLTWVEDESNQNTDFERNFLRHNVLPILTDKWPDLAKSVSRSASLCAQQQELLDELSAEKLHDIQASTNSLDIPSLTALSGPWMHQIVRLWLSQQNIPNPSLSILDKLRPELLDAKEDAKPIIQWGDWQFRRFDQKLFVIPVDKPIPAQTIVWQKQANIALPQPLGTFSFKEVDAKLTHDEDLLVDTSFGDLKIQFGGFSQRFTPAGSAHSKPLKQWYKEWKIAPWQRDKIVLISQNDRPLALLIEGQWCRAAHMPVLQQQPSSGGLSYLRYSNT